MTALIANGEHSRQRVWFQTRHPDCAVEYVERLYGPHTLRLQPAGELDMQLSGFDIAGLNLSSVRYGCPAEAQLLQRREAWVFSLVTSGTTALGHDAASVGDTGALAPDCLRSIPMSPDFELINLRVGSDALNEAYRALLGHQPDHVLTLPGLMPAASRAAQSLRGLLERLAQVPVYTHPCAPALERRLQEAALFELLMTWPHPEADRLANPEVLPRAARLARDFMHSHVRDSATLSDIAHAAGIGVRALTRSFSRTFGVSPMRYLSALRLDHARTDLLDAPPGTTVTDVAYRWGFSNLGDFAAAYARRFSELPAATLRRRGP